MQGIEIAYLGAVSLGLCVLYGCTRVLLHILFNKKVKFKKPGIRSMQSLVVMIAISVIFYIVSYFLISDKFWANRFLHAFSGGFMVFLACLLAARDTKLPVSRVFIFTIGLMMVTLLGVLNEAIEVFLQHHVNYPFAPSAYDTILDMISNTVGFIIAALCLVPLVNTLNAYRPSRKRIAIRR